MIVIDYNMAFSISALVSSRDSHISPICICIVIWHLIVYHTCKKVRSTYKYVIRTYYRNNLGNQKITNGYIGLIMTRYGFKLNLISALLLKLLSSYNKTFVVRPTLYVIS